MIASLGYAVMLVLAATPARGQQKTPAAKEIDAATIAAYEELGAEYRRPVIVPGYARDSEHEARKSGLPGFVFRNPPLPKLPDVAVPFGIALGGSSFDPNFTDEDMKQLARLRNLAQLSLGSTKVGAAGLKELAILENLSELHLGEAQINAAGLKELAGFKGLRSLTFRGWPKNAPIKELVRLKDLEELDLSQTGLQANDIKELGALRRLTTICILNVYDSDLATLSEIGQLYALSNTVGKDGVRPKSADDVVSFVVSGGITPAGLTLLRTFKNLNSLRFFNNRFTDTWLKAVLQFENLAELDLPDPLHNCAVTGVGLGELGNLKNFVSLKLAGAPLPPSGIKELATLKNLTTFELSSRLMTDRGLSQLTVLEQLTALHLNKTEVTNTGMKEVAGFKNLAKLSLSHTRVRDFGVRELSGLKELSSLDLSYTEVTDAALRELVGLKKLATLNLIGTRTTDAGIAELQKALPDCKIDR